MKPSLFSSFHNDYNLKFAIEIQFMRNAPRNLWMKNKICLLIWIQVQLAKKPCTLAASRTILRFWHFCFGCFRSSLNASQLLRANIPRRAKHYLLSRYTSWKKQFFTRKHLYWKCFSRRVAKREIHGAQIHGRQQLYSRIVSAGFPRIDLAGKGDRPYPGGKGRGEGRREGPEGTPRGENSRVTSWLSGGLHPPCVGSPS